MKTLHLRIRASAGTGKTFRLTDRIIELLLLGAKPERLIALTFTRKAAGEFLIKTLRKLAELASDPTRAAEFCQRRGIQEKKTPADFLLLLRRVVDALDRIEFGTLDSFFYRILHSFGTEIGLAPSPQLLNEVSATLHERDLLHDVSNALSQAGIDLVDELLRGPARAKLKPLSLDFNLLGKIETLYILYSEASAWGDPRAIWGINGCPWESLSQIRQEALEHCQEPLATAISEFHSFGLTSDRLNTVATRLLSQADALFQGKEITIEYRNKKITLSSSECLVVRNAIAKCLWRALLLKLTQARRWHVVARAIRALRDQRLLSTNRLCFADLPVLLMRLTNPGNTSKMLDLQYRLDGWFDHWLLDEFQDTSRIQWQAIQPLLDEILQDTSGTRSFFYVGDVKQSIYGFRNGDPSLFDEIFHHYTKHAPDHIAEEALGESYRSAREIIEVVEKTFSPAALTRLGVNPAVIEKWNAAWTTHSAHRRNPSPGYVHKIHCPPEIFWQHVISIVKQTRILERPLTCALLVRTNELAQEAVQELMREGVPATTESNPHISADNPCGVAILMAARYVADPSDAFAQIALECGPLGRPDEQFAVHGLETFHLFGAYGMVTAWLRILQLTAPHAFDSARAASIRRAAREFDEEYRGGSPRAFAEFLAAYTDPTSARSGTVQVMTIHKAKGLEFDLVFVPVSKDTRIDRRERADVFCSDKVNLEGHPWILGLPPETLCAADPILNAANQSVRDQSTFENLCMFYVAETRARRALVMLLPETPLVSEITPSRLLDAGLPPSCEEVDFSSWFSAIESTQPQSSPRLSPLSSVSKKNIPRSRPSDGDHGQLPGAAFFSELGGLGFGAEVHNLLAAIEWLPQDSLPTESSLPARRAVETFLLNAQTRQLFERPSPEAVVWRERSVACLVDDTIISAQMDRVIIQPPQPNHTKGKIILVDFKTDQGEPRAIARRYIPQIAAYVKILEAWSKGNHDITAVIATIRNPAVVPVWPPS